MDRPAESRDVAGFLTALVDDLAVAPDELTAARHVSIAAATARAQVLGPRTLRWVAAVTAVVTALGTGGVAMAGALPDPVQTAVADVARVLPLPIAVPYPHTRLADPAPVDHPEIDTWSQPALAEPLGDEPEEPVDAPVVTGLDESSSEHPRQVVADRSDQQSCASESERWDEGDQRESACGEFVVPSRFDQDEDRLDRDHENSREEIGDRDRESRDDSLSEARGDDSDQRGHDESDGQEERHDHESPDDDSSPGRD
jgi:hypothetical protein